MCPAKERLSIQEIMITASDIAMISLLGTIIEYGRNKVPTDIQDVLLILTFLSDNLKLGTCIQNWKNKDDYLKQLSLYISQESSIYSNIQQKLNFESIDSLIDLMDIAPEYLIQPTDADPNSVAFPYCFTRDSLVGIYVRSVIAKWEILHFGEISQVFESFQNFANCLSTSRPQINQPLKVHPVQSMVLEEPRAYLINAEKATINSDLLPAVESIHAYFDSNGTNPLLSKNDLVGQTKTIIDNYLSGSPEQKSRYQQAMLSLANMWLRNGYYFYASTATEEGMKMAHHLGDHNSVTYALLLLHHIIHGQENLEIFNDDSKSSSINSSEQSTENILIRCIQKSFELKLKSLEIQAIQLLVRYRMKGPFCECVPTSIGFSIPDSAIRRSCVTNMTPFMLWTFLHSTFSEKPSPLFMKTSQPKQKTPTADSAPASVPLNAQSKLELFCNTYLLSSDMWSRLYLPSMSVLMCFRAFRHCGGSISTNLFLEIILKFCSHIHEICDDGSICLLYAIRLGSSSSQQTKLRYTMQKLKLSLNILNSLSTMDQLTQTLSPDIKLKMQYTKSIIQIKLQIVFYFLNSEPSNGIEYIQEALRVSNMLIENLLNQPKYFHSSEYVVANIYYCFLMSFIDYNYALNRIAQLQKSFQRSECTHWKIELDLIKIIILHKEIYVKDRYDLSIQLKIDINECLKYSKSEYLPAVWTVLSLINHDNLSIK